MNLTHLLRPLRRGSKQELNMMTDRGQARPINEPKIVELKSGDLPASAPMPNPQITNPPCVKPGRAMRFYFNASNRPGHRHAVAAGCDPSSPANTVNLSVLQDHGGWMAVLDVQCIFDADDKPEAGTPYCMRA